MLAQPNFAKTPSSALNIAELADRYAGRLYGIGRRYRLTPEECDDAAQSTWLALCQNAEHIRDPQCVAGWLATTVRGSPPLHSGTGTGSCPPPTPWTFSPGSMTRPTLLTQSPPGRQHPGSIRPSANYPTGNDASSGCNSTRRSGDTHRSAAPYRCRSAASGRSAVAPSVDSERSSTTSTRKQCPRQLRRRRAGTPVCVSEAAIGHRYRWQEIPHVSLDVPTEEVHSYWPRNQLRRRVAHEHGRSD